MSWTDLIRSVDYTTIEINHGQTGSYLVADWILLQVFGANAFALRLPSLLSLILLLTSSLLIVHLRQLGRLWEIVVLLAVVAHSTLMGFAAEARPYMPPAASAVAMVLLFMTSSSNEKHRIARGVGAAGLFLGALMQAYWPLFLGFALTFGILVQYLDGKRWGSFREFSASMYLIWVVPAAAFYFLLGQLTWMRKSAEFGYDPFQWLGSPSEAAQSFLRLHLLLDIPIPIWFLLAVSTVISVA